MSVLFTRRGMPPAGGNSGGTTVSGILGSDLEIGSTVKLSVGGTLRDFLVVHHGIPSGIYDSSCNGVWLLMKDIYTTYAWNDSGENSYRYSTIQTYLDNQFLGLLNSNVQSVVKQVKIPYVDANLSVKSGSNGLSTKIFLLSMYEVGYTDENISYVPIDGGRLSFFNGTGNSNGNRIGYLNGTATRWWLRSPVIDAKTNAWGIRTSGGANGKVCYSTDGVRPALILPSNAVFDPTTKEFVGIGGNSGGSNTPSEPETTKYTITITGFCLNNDGVKIGSTNSTLHQSATTVEVDAGTKIYCYITAPGDCVYLNGRVVWDYLHNGEMYTYTVNSNISITLGFSGGEIVSITTQ